MRYTILRELWTFLRPYCAWIANGRCLLRHGTSIMYGLLNGRRARSWRYEAFRALIVIDIAMEAFALIDCFSLLTGKRK